MVLRSLLRRQLKLGALTLTALLVVTACSTSSTALPTSTTLVAPSPDQEAEEEPTLPLTETSPPPGDTDQDGEPSIPEISTPAPTPTSEPDKTQQLFIPDKVSAVDETTNFPSLTDPEFITAEEASLSADDLVLGLSMGGESKAYPLRQMWFHHVANDTIGGQPVTVTY